MNIITKFTIATEQGTSDLLALTTQIAKEKFTDLVDNQKLLDYIEDNFTVRTLVSELNSMSNQWLVVYVDEQPAGYAKITSKGRVPEGIHQKRIMRIADFGILKQYTDPEIRKSLLQKCLTTCKSYDTIWINEYEENPLLSFFESVGFLRHTTIHQHDDLPLSSIVLSKDQDLPKGVN